MPDFDLGHRILLVTLDQHQIDRGQMIE
jgi:hypothetical protein